jgi:hypothetical protein
MAEFKSEHPAPRARPSQNNNSNNTYMAGADIADESASKCAQHGVTPRRRHQPSSQWSSTMQVDKQQFQILNALDAILNGNRQSELPQLIEAAGADKIINADLMNLARKLKRSAVVNFLATLITHNSAKPEQAPLILDAYQSIASSKLQAALLALPSANVVRLTVTSIIERRQQTTLLLTGSSMTSPATSDMASGNDATVAPDPVESAQSPATSPLATKSARPSSRGPSCHGA